MRSYFSQSIPHCTAACPEACSPRGAWCLGVLVLLFLTTALHGQQKGGILRGTVIAVEMLSDSVEVYDSTESRYERKLRRYTRRYPLVGAKVQLKQTSLGALTDTTGFFRITGIPKGMYDVVFSAEGYKTHIFKRISIRQDTITEIDNFLVESIAPASELIVTASRYEQRLQDISNSLSILSESFLQNRNSIALDDGLRYVSGVNFAGPNMNIRSSSGISFGIGSRVLTLIDNIPVIGPAEGDSKWDFFPTDFLERIEIIKGPASSLFGSAALGGVVNVITKQEFQPKTLITLYGGSYDAPRFERWRWTDDILFQSGVEVSHANQFGPLSAYASLSRRYDDGYRENSGFTRSRLFSKVNLQLSDRDVLSLTAAFAEERKGNSLFWQDLDNPLRDGLGEVAPDGSRILASLYSDKLLLAPVYTLKFSQTGDLAIRGRYFQTKFFDSEGLSNNSIQAGTEVQTTFLFARGFAVTLGADGAYSTVASTLFGDHRAVNMAGYVQADLPLYPVIVTFGARYDGQWINDGPLSGQFNPRAGVNLKVSETMSGRFSLGRGFRNPSISERFTATAAGALQIEPNPNLVAESSSSFELGYLTSFARDIPLFAGIQLEELSLDVALFYTFYDNLIEPRPVASAGGLRPAFSFINVTEARVAGYELSLYSNFNRKSLEIELSYTHTDPKEANGGWLLYRNRRLFYSTLRTTVEWFSAEWNYRFISRFERGEPILSAIVADADAAVDAHVHDLRLSALTPFGMVSAILRNLTNAAYVEQPALFAPMRSVVLQFRTSF